MSLYTYNATVIRVVDGDTVDLDVDLGFDIHQFMRTRLYGINAPEMNTAAGKEAREFLLSMLPLDAEVLLHSHKDKRDKYGRYLARLEFNGVVVNDEMVATGHAVEYML